MVGLGLGNLGLGKIDTVRVRAFSVVHPLPNFLDSSLQTFYETKHNRPEIIFKGRKSESQNLLRILR